MPSITLMDPWGTCYHIDTHRPSVLQAWFTEMLPLVNRAIGTDKDIPPASITVMPLFAGNETGRADWHMDARVLGAQPFKAKTGAAGMQELEELRAQLQAKLEDCRERDGY